MVTHRTRLAMIVALVVVVGNAASTGPRERERERERADLSDGIIRPRWRRVAWLL